MIQQQAKLYAMAIESSQWAPAGQEEPALRQETELITWVKQKRACALTKARQMSSTEGTARKRFIY